jgi:low affinity Fe/Cu permease
MLSSTFDLLALRSQRWIASPIHFVGFLTVCMIWLPWALSRGFDSLSQLSVNTPTTLAEYAFAVLTLRAALRAGDAAEQTAAHISARVDQLAEELAQLLEEHHSHIVTAVRRDDLA